MITVTAETITYPFSVEPIWSTQAAFIYYLLGLHYSLAWQSLFSLFRYCPAAFEDYFVLIRSIFWLSFVHSASEHLFLFHRY